MVARDSGAAIIGVVLSSLSPRRGSRELVKELKECGMNVASVYTDIETCLMCDSGEDYAQMHFPGTAAEMGKVREDGRKIISVIDIDKEDVESIKTKEKIDESDLVLLESRNGIAEKMEDIRFLLSGKVGVAGKISKGNIREILKYNPGFVDVSSSLEIQPGKKNVAKVKEFFREAGYGN
ncbi:MAG: hypothetical protein M1597_02920 [Candidatus Thermoplasmatota archaeon]|nr:hypothetical protein [Candidatus Thermoplasmatota archaeon]